MNYRETPPGSSRRRFFLSWISSLLFDQGDPCSADKQGVGGSGVVGDVGHIGRAARVKLLKCRAARVADLKRLEGEYDEIALLGVAVLPELHGEAAGRDRFKAGRAFAAELLAAVGFGENAAGGFISIDGGEEAAALALYDAMGIGHSDVPRRGLRGGKRDKQIFKRRFAQTDIQQYEYGDGDPPPGACAGVFGL